MNRKKFFSLYKDLLDKDKTLTQKEVDALDLFLEMHERNKDYFTIPQWAYVFATVFHETAFTFEPVREAFHLSESWRERNLRYYPYYGRGYVQLTWDYNYEKFSKLMKIDIFNKPDLAMQPEIAFMILIYGIKHGEYTGRSISRYVNEDKKDYKKARYVINGTDKRDVIAAYAVTFESILKQTV